MPSWLPKSNTRLAWLGIFILLFLLFHDVWWWGLYKPLIFGFMPFWVLYQLILAVVTALAIYAFAVTAWPSAPEELDEMSATGRGAE